MKFKTLLELGRISNLPTVWSNVLCGALLAAREVRLLPLVAIGLAGTAFYVGGMFLNDAFDAEIDARERPNRPIPSGRATRRVVFAVGFGLLALGLVVAGLAAVFANVGSPLGLLGASVATSALVVIYDSWHKKNPASPVVMGLCRAGLYGMGGFAVSEHASLDVAVGAGALALYVVGLTHIARFETASRVARVWPSAFVLAPLFIAALRGGSSSQVLTNSFAMATWVLAAGWALFSIRLALKGGRSIGRAVVSLIAGISLVDAAQMASVGAVGSACFGLGAFALTLFGQRFIRGT
jgi:4-hydroxybenzoate polyprenyltransferase